MKKIVATMAALGFRTPPGAHIATYSQQVPLLLQPAAHSQAQQAGKTEQPHPAIKKRIFMQAMNANKCKIENTKTLCSPSHFKRKYFALPSI